MKLARTFRQKMGNPDKEVLIEETEHGHTAVVALVTMTALFVAASIAVTVLTYLDIQSLDKRDVALRLDIEKLISKLNNVQSEDLFEEILETTDYQEVGQLPDSVYTKSNVEKRSLADRSTGLFDAILKAQESVFEKYCKAHNETCPQGEHGDKGVTGDVGLPGHIGIAGNPGVTGPQGDIGVTGVQGANGEPGAKGERGANGTSGSIGEKGATGVSGLQGLIGDPGQMGNTGVVGATGDNGTQGPQGYPGSPGAQGLKGEQGDPGHKGLQGDRGVIGLKGQDVKKFADDCDCLKTPSFRSTEDRVVRSARGSLKLPCQATGNPAPTLTIYYQGKALYTNDDLVTDVRNLDEYTCTASNEFGSVSKNVTILPSFQ